MSSEIIASTFMQQSPVPVETVRTNKHNLISTNLSLQSLEWQAIDWSNSIDVARASTNEYDPIHVQDKANLHTSDFPACYQLFTELSCEKNSMFMDEGSRDPILSYYIKLVSLEWAACE